jgi:copper(I)-binding protein
MQIQKLTLMSIASAALAAYLSVAPARAADVKAGDLVVSQAWSRATPKGRRPAAAISPSRTRAARRTG